MAPLTSGFAAICVLLHFGLNLLGLHQQAVFAAGFIPVRFSPDFYAPDIFFLPAILTPVTSAFLHGDGLHLLFNMLILIFLGRQVEAPLGAKFMGLFLLAGALGGAAGQYLADPQAVVPMIGASGAISALLALYASVFSRSETKAIGPIPSHIVRALWLAVAWIGLQVMIGVAGGGFANIAIWAHVGGFVTGLVMARPMLRWRFRHHP